MADKKSLPLEKIVLDPKLLKRLLRRSERFPVPEDFPRNDIFIKKIFNGRHEKRDMIYMIDTRSLLPSYIIALLPSSLQRRFPVIGRAGERSLDDPYHGKLHVFGDEISYSGDIVKVIYVLPKRKDGK